VLHFAIAISFPFFLKNNGPTIFQRKHFGKYETNIV